MSTHGPRVSTIFQIFLHHFVLAKLATSSIGVEASIPSIVNANKQLKAGMVRAYTANKLSGGGGGPQLNKSC